jgi:hypothetical protein
MLLRFGSDPLPVLQDDTIDRVLVPAADVQMEVIGDEVLLYLPQHASAVYLSPTAAFVWALCDGSRSARVIIDLIKEDYPDAGANLSEDVLATLDQLQESGVLVVE